ILLFVAPQARVKSEIQNSEFRIQNEKLKAGSCAVLRSVTVPAHQLSPAEYVSLQGAHQRIAVAAGGQAQRRVEREDLVVIVMLAGGRAGRRVARAAGAVPSFDAAGQRRARRRNVPDDPMRER